MTTVCLLYPGDMGAAVARLLVNRGHRVVSCVEGRSSRTKHAAVAAGVTLAATLEEAVAESDLAISLVPQDSVLIIAAAFVDAVRRMGVRPLYLEANSVSPSTAREVATLVAAANGDCVDGAFVGSASMLGGKTTLFLSGALASSVHDLLGTAFRVTVLGPEVGLASAFKLSFASFNKGLVALFLEAMAGADRAGHGDALFECLNVFYPGTVDTIERLLPTYPRHAGRRIEELCETVHWLRAIGQACPIAVASVGVLEAFRSLDLQTEAEWDASGIREECRRRGLLAESEGDRRDS